MVVRTATTFAILLAFLFVEEFRFEVINFFDGIGEKVSPHLRRDVSDEELYRNNLLLMFNFTKSSSDVLVKFAAVAPDSYYALVTLNDGYLTFTAIGPNIFIQERLVSSCNCRLNDGKEHKVYMIVNKHLGAYFYVDNVIVRRQMYELNQESSPESDRIAKQIFQREKLIYSDDKVDSKTMHISLPAGYRTVGFSVPAVEIF